MRALSLHSSFLFISSYTERVNGFSTSISVNFPLESYPAMVAPLNNKDSDKVSVRDLSDCR